MPVQFVHLPPRGTLTPEDQLLQAEEAMLQAGTVRPPEGWTSPWLPERLDPVRQATEMGAQPDPTPAPTFLSQLAQLAHRVFVQPVQSADWFVGTPQGYLAEVQARAERKTRREQEALEQIVTPGLARRYGAPERISRKDLQTWMQYAQGEQERDEARQFVQQFTPQLKVMGIDLGPLSVLPPKEMISALGRILEAQVTGRYEKPTVLKPGERAISREGKLVAEGGPAAISPEAVEAAKQAAREGGKRVKTTIEPLGVTKVEETEPPMPSIGTSFVQSVDDYLAGLTLSPEEKRILRMNLLGRAIPRTEFGEIFPSQVPGVGEAEEPPLPARATERYWDNEQNQFASGVTRPELQAGLKSGRFRVIPLSLREKLPAILQFKHMMERVREIMVRRPDLWPEGGWWDAAQGRMKTQFLQALEQSWLGAGDPDISTLVTFLASLPQQAKSFGEAGRLSDFDIQLQQAARAFTRGGSAQAALRNMDEFESLIRAGLAADGITSIFPERKSRFKGFKEAK